jgi:hypothetical protein
MAQPTAGASPAADPRIGLRAGYLDAAIAIRGMELLATVPRPAGFFDPERPGAAQFSNTDLAFRGGHAIIGNYHGFLVYDVSTPSSPRLRASVACPGGQGDVSVFGNLVFISVEERRGRVDCGAGGVPESVSPERFRGVRIFDVSDLDRPRQVATVQTCRGSHTHTLLEHPGDREHVYVYVSGTSAPRPAEELEGCSGLPPEENPETALFRIEVIRVPLAAPHLAEIVSRPRIFADRATGNVAGLWPGGDHGPGTQSSRATAQCHDITTYPALGLAAGACSGNGIVLDIRDPANPVRLTEVTDPGFAFWHSATFSNDGSKIVFTDEWGGGTQARCRASDSREWGANAIYEVVDGELHFRSYYKLPAPQSATENCVAHNGSLVPVPGRDIKVQSWYQGGISVFDFTDPRNPVEIAFFDRGPMSDTELIDGGHWSAYWYNGAIYGAEIYRGLDVLRLTPSEQLTQNEIDAATLVRMDEFNPQHQPRVTWPAHPSVARAYVDQLARTGGLTAALSERVERDLAEVARALPAAGLAQRLDATAAELGQAARRADGEGRRADAGRLDALAAVLRELGRGGSQESLPDS